MLTQVSCTPDRPHTTGRRDSGPVALAVDLGSCTTGVWAARRGSISASCTDPGSATAEAVRRGRIVDADECIASLSALVRRYVEPVPRGGVIVACRPVLSGEAELRVSRRVLQAVFQPRRVLFIDSVRAAAIGSGAAAGTLLVVDVGAELTEVALLREGRVTAARRIDIGVRDLARGATLELITDAVASHVNAVRAGPGAADLPAALRRGALLVGAGASQPELTKALARTLRAPVHRAASPVTAALHGAGQVAKSILRHPAGA
ncbi:rod shape-determining protein [Actinoplanes sp. TRM 88003]|uniref:Rod shape-determining protein n=1 Tax=Paractinoplanes aksuensis TaxID=2939490 RepID=A0ABT1E4V5_9ACTN|nr:rod shape-determining protein [Actinoplanes aksuensis]MCO8278062.1 rod shape-determining protein [Actinoplanes aksuensis]